MKPIIIAIQSNSDKICLTIKELESMLEKAYNAGKTDGGETHYHYDPYPYPWRYDTTHWWYNTNPCTTPQITCVNGPSVGDATTSSSFSTTTATTTLS